MAPTTVTSTTERGAADDLMLSAYHELRRIAILTVMVVVTLVVLTIVLR